MEKGICCICGNEEELTYEHIPPQGSGNISNVKGFNLRFLGEESEEKLLGNLDKHTFDNLVAGKKYKQFQRGFGISGTCGNCNNTIKAVYDTEYNNLTNWVLSQIQNDPKLISEECKSVKIVYPDEFTPLYFLKCILSMFAVLYGESLFEEHQSLREFVLEKDCLTFDSSRYKVYMFLLKSQIIYKCEPAAAGSVATLEGKNQFLDIINGDVEPPITLEFGAYPFGFVLDIDNTIHRTDLSDLTQCITPNRYKDLEFRLNAFGKDSPIPCQFV